MLMAMKAGAMRGRRGIALPPPAAWNPSDKHSSIILSEDNFKAAGNDEGAWRSVRGLVSKSSGKWYFEAKNTSSSSGTASQAIIGIGTSSASLASFPGSSSSSYGLGAGTVYGAAEDPPTGPSIALNDVAQWAVDFSAGKFFLGKNGTWHGGSDPATASGGYALTAGTYFPMGGFFDIGPAYTLQASIYGPPAGFSVWS